jgi:hypothetical protein
LAGYNHYLKYELGTDVSQDELTGGGIYSGAYSLKTFFFFYMSEVCNPCDICNAYKGTVAPV